MRRFIAMVSTLALATLGVTLVTSPPASAGFTWAANSWGACNTSKPGGYSPIYFQYVSRPSGRPANYYYSQCFYWGYTGRYYLPVYTAINWNYACSLDAYGRYSVQVRPDNTVWCVG